MAEEDSGLELVDPGRFIKHLKQFEDTFACPCCNTTGSWSIQMMTIGKDLIDNRDGGYEDVDAMIPRQLPAVNVRGAPQFPFMQVLPAICQRCGYVALFDAKIVSGGDDDQ